MVSSTSRRTIAIRLLQSVQARRNGFRWYSTASTWAVVLQVAAALVVLLALLGDREVVAHGRAVPLGPVLLGRGEPRGVRPLHEKGGVPLVVATREQVVAAAEGVEVVVLHGVEAVPGAAVGPAPHDPRQRPALRPGAEIEQPLAPDRVDHRLAVVLQHQRPVVVAPERLLLDLRLEPVDVADVVLVPDRGGVPVALDDADMVRHRAGAPELVVPVGASGRQGDRPARVRRRQEAAEDREDEGRDHRTQGAPHVRSRIRRRRPRCRRRCRRPRLRSRRRRRPDPRRRRPRALPPRRRPCRTSCP